MKWLVSLGNGSFFFFSCLLCFLNGEELSNRHVKSVRHENKILNRLLGVEVNDVRDKHVRHLNVLELLRSYGHQ